MPERRVEFVEGWRTDDSCIPQFQLELRSLVEMRHCWSLHRGLAAKDTQSRFVSTHRRRVDCHSHKRRMRSLAVAVMKSTASWTRLQSTQQSRMRYTRTFITLSRVFSLLNLVQFEALAASERPIYSLFFLRLLSIFYIISNNRARISNVVVLSVLCCSVRCCGPSKITEREKDFDRVWNRRWSEGERDTKFFSLIHKAEYKKRTRDYDDEFLALDCESLACFRDFWWEFGSSQGRRDVKLKLVLIAFWNKNKLNALLCCRIANESHDNDER